MLNRFCRNRCSRSKLTADGDGGGEGVGDVEIPAAVAVLALVGDAVVGVGDGTVHTARNLDLQMVIPLVSMPSTDRTHFVTTSLIVCMLPLSNNGMAPNLLKKCLRLTPPALLPEW